VVNPPAWSWALDAEHAVMLRAIACLLAGLAVLSLGGCGSQAERNETRDDLKRFRQSRVVEVQQLKRELDRALRTQGELALELPHDAAAFFAWRHREWRRLNDDLAIMLAYEWEAVESLYVEVSRCYGYEVRNFPRLPADVARFIEAGDQEMVALIIDVMSFLEWRDREMLPLRSELQDAYLRAGWEVVNLKADATEFLQWRNREWSRFVDSKNAFMLIESQQGKRMREDLRRFRAARALEAQYLVADLAAVWRYDGEAMPNRMVADLCRWGQLPAQEAQRLHEDIQRFGEGISEDALTLIRELGRLNDRQIDLIPLLVADVDRFLASYDREFAPLQAGVRRWWRTNVGLGIVLREDFRIALMESQNEEYVELQASMRRFISYAGKEWKDFKGALGRFLHDDSGRAFGDRSMPMAGDAGRAVFEDPRAYPARGYDAGEE
jgi:hypothetical protein